LNDKNYLRYLKLYDEVKKHYLVLNKAFESLSHYDMKNYEENLELLRILDQIAYRFSKLQDSIGKLLRAYLTLKGENVENLPIIDVINLAEKFNLPIDKKFWFEMREIANLITCEYEEDYEKIIITLELIKSSLQRFKELIEALRWKSKRLEVKGWDF